MFSNRGLFSAVSCPDQNQCKRIQCIFSHSPDAKQSSVPYIPVSKPQPNTSDRAGPSGDSSWKRVSGLSPSKRPMLSSPSLTPRTVPSVEPPTKLRRLDSPSKVSPTPAKSTLSSNGAPVLRINAAQSYVAVPVRQTMLAKIYEHFVELYANILHLSPTLAAEHALAQEDEVYKQSNKTSYRNAVISSIAAMKKRVKPDSITHESVGTNEGIRIRKEKSTKIESLKLTREHLHPLTLSIDVMKQWGYVTEVPDGSGGTAPHDEGKKRACERCTQHFLVRADPDMKACTYHWARPYSSKINGERLRTYRCCSRNVSDSEGCEQGPHVFSDSEFEQLHARHAFSETRAPVSSEGTDTALDVVALDCEMIYTTGGMRVARVSVVDGAGKEILDEIIRMDEGVTILDFNTRFSGITQENYDKAVLDLSSVRKALDAYINSETIIVGHALENDLKTLRIVHSNCVDTAVLYPHRSGAPYRRALRELAREHLNRRIQMGGATEGHSSIEDSIATLDLVRNYILSKSVPAQVADSGPSKLIAGKSL